MLREKASITWHADTADFFVANADSLIDAHSIALCSAPISLLPDLAAFLAPEVDIKVKNGVIGLLKNLAIAPPNRKLLGAAGVLQKLASSEIWSDKYDMVELVQVAAIGIAKHICNANCKSPASSLLLSAC